MVNKVLICRVVTFDYQMVLHELFPLACSSVVEFLVFGDVRVYVIVVICKTI